MNHTSPLLEGTPLSGAAAEPRDCDPRAAEILASVRQTFSEKGFDGASMQDLAKAAGMSVGNFYRYFPSKSGIVEAIIESDLRMIEADFAVIVAAAKPFDRLKSMVRERLPHHAARESSDLWAEISVVAQRDSDIGAAAARMESRIRTALHSVIARETGLSLPAVSDRFGPEADFILLLFKASSCTTGTYPGHQARLNELIIANIDQILDTISQTARNT